MGPFILAWMVGEGIVIYRTSKAIKGPPSPGNLMYVSGIFVLLALLAESPKARSIATTLAWGFDIAAFINLFPLTNIKTSGNTWKPAIAPNTVILPGGQSASSGGGSQDTSQQNTGGSGSGNGSGSATFLPA